MVRSFRMVAALCIALCAVCLAPRAQGAVTATKEYVDRLHADATNAIETATSVSFGGEETTPVVEIVAQAFTRVISSKYDSSSQSWSITTNYYAVVDPSDFDPYNNATNQLAQIRALLDASDRSTLNNLNSTLDAISNALQ